MIVLRRYAGNALILACVAFALLLLYSRPAALGMESSYQELDADRCYMFSALVPYKSEGNNVIELPFELVINSEQAYMKLFDPKIIRQSCASANLAVTIPKVDFTRSTVLGLWASGSCAATGFKKKVWWDDTQKQVTYYVAVIESTVSCSGPGLESINLITIPKIPAGYRVSFRYIHG